MTLNAIKEKLHAFYGTEHYYKGIVPNCLYTDGFKAYMEMAACFWLFDIIQTECFDVIRKLRPDTHYFTIEVNKEKAHLHLKDYQDNLLWERKIDFTTHPEGNISFPFGFDGEIGVICLHSEN